MRLCPENQVLVSGEGLGPVRVDIIQGGPGYSGMQVKQPTVDITSACAQYPVHSTAWESAWDKLPAMCTGHRDPVRQHALSS